MNGSARIAGGCCIGGDTVQRASLVCAIAIRHFLMNPIQEEANAEALRRIREVEKAQTVTLDFSDLHSLNELPQELERLTSLQPFPRAALLTCPPSPGELSSGVSHFLLRVHKEIGGF